MERRYRLVRLDYGPISEPPRVTELGEFTNREELNEAIKKHSWKGGLLSVDFLVDGVWYRGTTESRDPIAWESTDA